MHNAMTRYSRLQHGSLALSQQYFSPSAPPPPFFFCLISVFPQVQNITNEQIWIQVTYIQDFGGVEFFFFIQICSYCTLNICHIHNLHLNFL